MTGNRSGPRYRHGLRNHMICGFLFEGIFSKGNGVPIYRSISEDELLTNETGDGYLLEMIDLTL